MQPAVQRVRNDAAPHDLLGVEHYIIRDFPERSPVLHRVWPEASPEDSRATATVMLTLSAKGSTDGRSLGGLSSVQVGLPGRVVTYRSWKTGTFFVLENPVVVHESEERVMGIEGCYSLPATAWYLVERPKSVTVEHTVDFGRMETVLHDYEARFCLHEIDHLNGVMISDIGRLRS